MKGTGTEPMLFDFSGGASTASWSGVHDRVMGGCSTGRLTSTGAAARFEGVLSLENSGGFASTRAPVGPGALGGASTLELHVRGDGREYLALLLERGRRDGTSYRAPFRTYEGEWNTVQLPLDAFVKMRRGERVPSAAPVDPALVTQVGIMLADARPGPFALEIGWVRVLP